MSPPGFLQVCTDGCSSKRIWFPPWDIRNPVLSESVEEHREDSPAHCSFLLRKRGKNEQTQTIPRSCSSYSYKQGLKRLNTSDQTRNFSNNIALESKGHALVNSDSYGHPQWTYPHEYSKDIGLFSPPPHTPISVSAFKGNPSWGVRDTALRNNSLILVAL